MRIQVIHRKEYGKDRFYPDSPDTINLLKLMRKKTLTKYQVIECKKFGWKVSIIADNWEI